MKRLLVGIALAALFALGVRWAYRALASEETHIRWRLEEMADGFNRTRLQPCMDGLAQGFLDETSGADRELIKQAIISVFFRAKDPETKRFIYRAEIPEDELQVQLSEEDPTEATATFVLRVHRSVGGVEHLAWTVRIVASLNKGEEGWQIARCGHETTGGERITFAGGHPSAASTPPGQLAAIVSRL